MKALIALVSAGLGAAGLLWCVLGLPLGVDTAVYRAGGWAVLHGEPLYEHLRALPGWTPELPFTYPPFAALLFTPFATLPAQLCWSLLAMTAAPALLVTVRAFTDDRRWWLVLGGFALYPVWQGIGLGQVNLVLMALVVTDVLVLRDSRYRGLLIGLAAAIKLVPLIFIGHLLLTGRRTAALRALGAFAAATALGFLVLPEDSVRYWTSAIFNDHFAQTKGWIGNQSWQGFVARTAPEDWGLPLTAGFCVPAVFASALVARRLHLAGDARGALLTTAGCALLVSPISWTHHWVWLVPLLAFRPSLRLLAPVFALPVAITGELYLITAVVLLGARVRAPSRRLTRARSLR
ncbi:glycosyltransferase 87 family protein [Amycolatopsis magusensis]|uniref:glycosyltransferase 87 family protein n=1 Tax=Amycolatopsis magusensis TaxID=882444 RepID=UPI0024A9CF35|nr:glycosyltransferase 87 family protein [Amycolatopsis magusensis]MDI5977069.1 glycosyltransferase 87 family protein [Amycolatopsis magusensis]